MRLRVSGGVRFNSTIRQYDKAAPNYLGAACFVYLLVIIVLTNRLFQVVYQVIYIFNTYTQPDERIA